MDNAVGYTSSTTTLIMSNCPKKLLQTWSSWNLIFIQWGGSNFMVHSMAKLSELSQISEQSAVCMSVNNWRQAFFFKH